MAEPSQTPELISYSGNCHCGAFKYTAKLPEIKTGYACNCSICHKKGYLWAFPGPGCFDVERGEDKLTAYEFGKKSMAHKFCSNCGTGVIGLRHNVPAGQNLGLNLRTLRDFNVRSIEPLKYDGLKLDPPYEVPKFAGTLPEEKDGMKIYTGGCHCGAVMVALQSEPLPEVKVKGDNCSICQRNATNFVYPAASQVTIVGEENTKGYLFGQKHFAHHFCKTCGVPVYVKMESVSKEVMESWPAERQEAMKKFSSVLPVNVKALDGVEWDQLQVELTDQGTDGYIVD